MLNRDMPFVPDYDSDPETWAAIEQVWIDRPAGMALLRSLAAEGRRNAILSLGLFLGEGNWSEEAEAWLRRAAEFESPDAAWNLAMFARHRGDTDAMKAWLDRAADWGSEDAEKVRLAGYDVDVLLAAWRDEEAG